MVEISDLQRSILIIIFASTILFLHNQPSGDFLLEFSAPVDQFSSSGVSTRIDINASGHVYPYTATAVTFSCLLAVTMIIICLGGQLG